MLNANFTFTLIITLLLQESVRIFQSMVGQEDVRLSDW